MQAAALAIADIAYPKANLEHAAASAPNLIQTATLILLLTLPLLGMTGPEVTLLHVHPVTPLLILATAGGLLLTWNTRCAPMWRPTMTAETVADEPAPEHQRASLARLVVLLVISAGLTGLAGAAVAEAGSNVVARTGWSDAVVGGLFMAVATSLPELVTSVAAVRRGALTLAVSNVVGGNFFDVLFVAAADLVYLRGSLYHGSAVGRDDLFLTGITILMNVILLLGLVYRQKRGPGNIGLESVLMLAVYVAGFLVVALAM